MFTVQKGVLLRPSPLYLQYETRFMPNVVQLCLIMQRLLAFKGVAWMKRRSKQRMTAIHVSIPVRLLEDFDETLTFSQSRSAKIAALLRSHLENGAAPTVTMMSTRQLMAALTSREDVDDTMKVLLLQILTKTP